MSGELKVEGQFITGSNYTFLGQVIYEDLTLDVVYKPSRGELPLWDFPTHSLGKREVAAYVLSEALGWGLVPITVFRKDGPLGPGSVQLYVEHDTDEHYFTFSEATKQKLRPVVLFDLLANNADRKGGHILEDAQGKIWLIDHGICFHEEDKLRTVVWDFAGEPIPEDLLNDIQDLLARLEDTSCPTYQELACYLDPGEMTALKRRARRLLREKTFPSPGSRRRPYPWPPV
ncbi:MAG TPA: SCO1664 family protein [Chloroflexi bacterium]|nr:SCO1664 family protein [Chloroflexota bacterium]HPO57858.1 SCO1664 family protein [Anaerolineaceae bacterium]